MLRLLQIIAFTFLTLSLTLKSEIISDSVKLGKDYKLDVWYNIVSGFAGESDAQNWDIAFETSGMGGGIHVNGAKGVKVWLVPDKSVDDFNSFSAKDTLGMSDNWETHLNSEDTWTIGAFNLGRDGFETDGDYGWGSYQMATHYIVGDKLFVIKLTNNNYVKFYIESFSNGEYSFVYANLDGKEESLGKVTKKSFTGKNFGYFSFDKSETLDREPAAKDWQLVFGKYEINYPLGGDSFMPYVVTGVRQNKGVRVAKVTNENQDNAEPADWNSDNYFTKITTIGSDWKTFNMGTSSYDISKDLVYFISTDSLQNMHPQIYRLYFTEFSGSSTGLIKFNKEVLPVSVIENDGLKIADVLIYPSIISIGDNFNITINNFSTTNQAHIDILSLDGRILQSMNMNLNSSLSVFQTNNMNLSSGMYFVKITIDNKSSIEKLIVK